MAEIKDKLVTAESLKYVHDTLQAKIDSISQESGDNSNVPSGSSGENGATFIPSVSTDGVISWTNDKGLQNPSPVNIKGANGDDGKSAFDYAKEGGYTGTNEEFAEDINPENINANAKEYLTNELAKRTQLKPGFANSIAECIDASKLYVLPDGFIYADVTQTTTIVPTNQIPISTNSDGTPFNDGQGWKTGCSLNAGSGEEYVSGNTTYYEVTGFIPVKSTDIIRIKDFEFASSPAAYDNLCFYDASFTFIKAFTNSSTANPLSQFKKDDGTYECCIANAVTTNFSSANKSAIAYVRFSCYRLFDTTFLTINEPLETTTTTISGWRNTGHAFVPADYEERIISLENSVAETKEAIETFKCSDSVADYVVGEAERVAKAVYSKQNANTFSFLAVADLHYLKGNENIENSILHAGQGMNLVRNGVNIDFGVVLGDLAWGSGVVGSSTRATIEMGIEEIRSSNSCIDNALRGIPNFRTVGNHDGLIYNYSFNNNKYLDSNDLFPLFGAYNRGAVFPSGEKERGYCYRDFDDWKLRVICMNTSDIQDLTPSDTTRPIYVSGTQGKWFAETIDLSSKIDASDWSILILSHTPLDWGSACIYICDILKAYIDGASVSLERDGVTISYNYAGKNTATIIGNCHGHNHNFLVDYLRRRIGDTLTTEPITIKRFCIPNACFDRTNERGENGLESGSDGVFDIEYGESVTYKKSFGTAKDTSFNVVTIDVSARKIYAHCFGAGYDREIDY